MRENLLLLKHYPYLCERVRALIARTIRQEPAFARVERVIPVPLHPRRLKERGFNQAAVIAQVVAREVGIPLDSRTVIRIKHTDRHRAGMDAVARMKSVAQAFVVTRPERIRGKTVLLVDDVFTTGATLNACGRVLVEAGAEAVYGFTVARVMTWNPIVP